MPLKRVDTPHYIKRTRLFVDSKFREESGSKNGTDYKFKIREEIQNVISMELIGWNIDSLISPTWTGRYNTPTPGSTTDLVASRTPGAHTYDIFIEDEDSPPVTSLLFTVDMEFMGELPASFAWRSLTSASDVVDVFATYVAMSFIYVTQASDPISYANTNMSIETTSEGVFQMSVYRDAAYDAAEPPMPSYFLFKSGPTADDNAGRALGFKDTEDTIKPALTTTAGIGSGTNYVLESSYLINMQPFRYVDIRVKEVEADFSPLSRVYLNRVTKSPPYIRPWNEGFNARLLTSPIRVLKDLSIRLTLDNNTRISTTTVGSHQLTFDVLSLAQVPIVPDWLEQRLLL